MLASLALIALVTAKPVFAADCPKADDPSAVTKWRQEEIRRFETGAGDTNAKIRRCFPGKIPRCLSQLSIQAKDRKPVSTEGPETALDVPGSWRKLPPPFQARGGKSTSPARLPRDLEAIAAKKGWKSVRFKTRSTGGFGASNSLLLIQVPGETLMPPEPVDRFIQVSLPPDNGSARYGNPVPQGRLEKADPQWAEDFAVITVRRGTSLLPSRFAYELFQPGKSPGAYTISPRSPSKECQLCHPNGLRQISPLGMITEPGEPALPDAAKAGVAAMNRLLASYPGVDWGTAKGGSESAFDAGRVPALGPVSPWSASTRTRNFLVGADGKSGCAFSQPSYEAPGRLKGQTLEMSGKPIRWERVRDAMSCATCHGAGPRQPLARTIRSEILFKVGVERSMPPAADLTDDERLALVSCLLAERKEEQKSFLASTSCFEGGLTSEKPCLPDSLQKNLGGLLGWSAGGGGSTSCIQAPAISDQSGDRTTLGRDPGLSESKTASPASEAR